MAGREYSKLPAFPSEYSFTVAISHICLNCGLDLARSRAVVDAALRLPVVTCPECGAHSVRRRHPLIVGWRRAFRVRQALWTLIGQVAQTLILGSAISGFGRQIAQQMRRDDSTLLAVMIDAFRVESTPGRYYDFVGPWQAGGWLLASAVAGMWLGSAFPHWRRWALLLAWAVWLLFMFSFEYIIEAIAAAVAWIAGDTTPWTVDSVWAVGVGGASLVITIAALPLGVPARRLWVAAQRRRWRKRLERRRKARSAE